MRIKNFFSIVVIMVLCFSALSTFSQVEEQKSLLNIVWDLEVEPSMVDEYEAATKVEAALYATYEFPYSWTVYSSDDFHYYFVIEIDDYATIDKLYKAFGELHNEAGEEYEAMQKSFLGTYSQYKQSTFRLMPEHSYTPEEPGLEPEEAKFIYWGFEYVKAGKEKEYEKVIKEWVELYKSKNILDGWNQYVGEIGADGPFYFYAVRAKSAADYYTRYDKNAELLGDEVKVLLNKTMALLRKFEYKTGMIRPELSYIIDEE